MEAVKAQKLLELRKNKQQEIEKTVYKMLESAGVTQEARDFIKVHESQQKALAQMGKAISVKDNETVVDSPAVKMLKNLGFGEEEIQEILSEMPDIADSEYDEIKDIAVDWLMERRSRNLVSFDEGSEMTFDDKVSLSF